MISSPLNIARWPITYAGLPLLACIHLTQAAVLWNQSPVPSIFSLADQAFPDSPGHDTYVVNDATFLTDV
ncbi:MAG: hypothetical protein ACKVHP_23420 [Verrucomicrobiales bacterium]